MSRKKIADSMIQYLEDRINCKNVMKFADEKMESILEQSDEIFISELKIDGNSVNFEIIAYNDTTTNGAGSGTKTKTSINNMFETFDFMVESNYTGFEYFPYLYGVLNCHNNENSKAYIYYENFQGDLLQLINMLEHPSEWYDIAFQLVIIDHYVRILNGYQYNAKLKNFLYKKLDKPYYRQYNINDHKFSVSNKYLITLWDIESIKMIPSVETEYTIIDALLDHIEKNGPLKVPLSNRLIKMFNDIKINPESTIEILQQYYSRPSTNS